MIYDYYTHENGKLAMVTHNGIFAYPDTDHYDFGDKEISVKLDTTWGNLYDLINQRVLYDIRIDYHGVGDGVFEVALYINDELTPFHTLEYPVSYDGVMWRRLPARGRIKSLRTVVDVGEDVEEFEISRITIGLVKRANIGNR